MIKYLAIYLFAFLVHPVHVSMSSMEYIPQDNGYRITVRMYSDDLLLDLFTLRELPEEYIADHVYTGPDDIYEEYINEKVQIRINNKLYSATLLDTEKLEIETIMRLFVDYDGNINTIDITNTILTAIYLDQVNLFIYKDEENELAFRFTPQYSEEKLNLTKEAIIP